LFYRHLISFPKRGLRGYARVLAKTGRNGVFETLLHKFYAASISVGADGSMLVSSTRERVLAWGMAFCLLAAASLIAWLLRRGRPAGRIALGVFGTSLLIPILIMPSVRHEYIRVTPSRITIDTGDWYRESRSVFPIGRQDRIREYRDGFLPGNLIGDPSVSWRVTRPDGGEDVLELNDFFAAHRMVVAYYIKDRGFMLERIEDRARAAD
jgi:hypothetical protein